MQYFLTKAEKKGTHFSRDFCLDTLRKKSFFQGPCDFFSFFPKKRRIMGWQFMAMDYPVLSHFTMGKLTDPEDVCVYI